VRRVERILVVVKVDPSGGTETKRFALLTDGERFADPGFSGMGQLLGKWAFDEEFRSMEEESVRHSYEREPGRFVLLADALEDAGIEVVPADLAALPLDVEIEQVDQIRRFSLTPEQEALAKRARILAWVLAIAIGAIWPSRIRYRVWQRHGWRRRIASGLAVWAFANLLKETLGFRQG
jgi:hypothetical protein